MVGFAFDVEGDAIGGLRFNLDACYTQHKISKLSKNSRFSPGLLATCGGVIEIFVQKLSIGIHQLNIHHDTRDLVSCGPKTYVVGRLRDVREGGDGQGDDCGEGLLWEIQSRHVEC